MVRALTTFALLLLLFTSNPSLAENGEEKLTSLVKLARSGQLSLDEAAEKITDYAANNSQIALESSTVEVALPAFDLIVGPVIWQKTASLSKEKSVNEIAGLRVLARKLLKPSDDSLRKIERRFELLEQLDLVSKDISAGNAELFVNNLKLRNREEKELVWQIVKQKLKSHPSASPKPSQVNSSAQLIKTGEKNKEAESSNQDDQRQGNVRLAIISLSLFILFAALAVIVLRRVVAKSLVREEDLPWWKRKNRVDFLKSEEAHDEYSKLLAFFNLNERASEAAIKKAYRDAVKKAHPDAKQSSSPLDDRAEQSFQEIHQKYERIIEMRKGRFGNVTAH